MPFLNRTGLRWDVVPMPRGPGGRGTRVTWDGLAMAADSTRKDQAWTFIHFVAGREAQEIIARTQRSVPALKEVQDLFVSARPQRDVHVERFIAAMGYARLQPITDQWEKMAAPLSQEFGTMLRDQERTPDEMIRRLAVREKPIFGLVGGEP
jgi:multiple sugar transport system substrate-binding protein